MRVVFSDAFAWANGPLPTVSGGRWAKPTGWPNPPIVSGHLVGGVADGENAAYVTSWPPESLTAHWSEVTVTLSDPYAGPTVFNSSTGSFYLLYVLNTAHALYRVTSYVAFQELAAWPASVATAPGDIFRLAVTLTNGEPVLTGYKNGVIIGTYIDNGVERLRLTGGAPGLRIYNQPTRFSHFTAGDYLAPELQFLVSGVSRRPDKGSFRFTERLGSRSSGEIAFTDRLPDAWERANPKLLHSKAIDGSSPQHGQHIEVTRGGVFGTTLFAGRLTQPTRSIPGAGYITYSCTIQDFSEACDRRLIAAEYQDRTLKSIVDAIMIAAMDAEGITTEGVETGPTVSRIVFGYIPVQQAFNELAKRTGLTHWVDYDRVLQFRARDSKVVPTEITDANAFGFSVTESSELYRNFQMIRGGRDITDVRTEEFHGDGKTRTVVVGFPVAKKPQVWEDRGAGFVQMTKVGIKGLDADGSNEWYWNGGSAEIVQDNSGVILSSTQTVRIVYQGEFPVVGQAAFPDEIATRASVEGTSGRYEAVEDDVSIDRGDIAIEKAVALLQRYGMLADVVTFSTYVDGLRAGFLVPITHTRLGLDGYYLIDSITGSVASPSKLLYQVTATGGNAFGVWQDFFLRLAASQVSQEPVKGEQLLLSRFTTDHVGMTDPVVTTVAARETRIGSARIGISEIGIT